MTIYDNMYDIAAENYGLVAPAEAKGVGASDKELSRLASGGRLVRLGRGVCCVKRHVSEPFDQYTEAVALADHAMQPYEVKLSYLGKPWVTVWLEVGHGEIRDADEPDMVVPYAAALLADGYEAEYPSLLDLRLRQAHQLVVDGLAHELGPRHPGPLLHAPHGYDA